MAWPPGEVRWSIYPPQAVYAPPRRGLRFSREEYRHILLAVAALTAAFTLSFVSPFGGGTVPTLRRIALIALGSAVAVVTGFLLHELMHKAVAQRYGAWAEFRSSPMGLVFAVITGLIGIVFAAPGAVYIAGPLTREQNGRVSVAGPLTNFVLGCGFLGGLLIVGGSLTGEMGEAVGTILLFTAYINVFLGGFNMIPIPPLDGSKVLAWNPAVWIALVAGIGAVFVGFFFPGFLVPLLG